MKTLVIGAGVTGCFTTALLASKGLDVTLLARGERADRLQRDGLHLHDAIEDVASHARLEVLRAPVEQTSDLAMVCVQAQHRAALLPLLSELRGRPTIWFLGNTSRGFDDAVEQLGGDRVLGGFPGVGGTWDGETLVYADHEKPGDPPFDQLVLGEVQSQGKSAADAVARRLREAGMNVEHHVPIMAWHWCHLAMVLPLAAAVYRHDNDLAAAAEDRALLKQTMRATAQALAAVHRAGLPVLPRGLHLMRWIPAALGARKIAGLLRSRFGEIAIAGHAAVAREEMRGFASDLLDLAGEGAGEDLKAVFGSI